MVVFVHRLSEKKNGFRDYESRKGLGKDTIVMGKAIHFWNTFSHSRSATTMEAGFRAVLELKKKLCRQKRNALELLSLSRLYR